MVWRVKIFIDYDFGASQWCNTKSLNFLILAEYLKATFRHE